MWQGELDQDGCCRNRQNSDKQQDQGLFVKGPFCQHINKQAL
jgi:hypothetical protein